MPPKPTHGGARDGAGRPPAEPTRVVAVRAPESQVARWEKAAARAQADLGQWIRDRLNVTAKARGGK